MITTYQAHEEAQQTVDEIIQPHEVVVKEEAEKEQIGNICKETEATIISYYMPNQKDANPT